MLRMALQSVADQTAVAKISRVFVSENGSDRKSQALSSEFSQLPITYLFRDPATTAFAHGRLLMKECLQGEFTAILHDDDWWLPHHIEDALTAFEAHPDASAFGANLLLFEEPALTDRNCDYFAWFGANFPPPTPAWRITHSNVLLASLLGLVVHYSSLVARTTALAESTHIYDLDNPYDNDRMLLFALSQKGPILYSSKLAVVVRAHVERETVRFGQDERVQRMAETTQWMVKSGLKPWELIAATFAQRLSRCPDDEIRTYFIREAILRPWCMPEIARHIDRETHKDFFAMYDSARIKFGAEVPRADPR